MEEKKKIWKYPHLIRNDHQWRYLCTSGPFPQWSQIGPRKLGSTNFVCIYTIINCHELPLVVISLTLFRYCFSFLWVEKILIKSGRRQYKVAPLYKNWETSASLSVNSMHKSFTKENLTLVLQNTCNGFYWLFKFTCILGY